jgi:hypothetical protein
MEFYSQNLYASCYICLNYLWINYSYQFVPPNVAHHKHLFAYVTRIVQQVFKTLVDVHKILTPIFVNVKLAQITNIMVWLRIPNIQIYEPTMVHHCVVNVIYFFAHLSNSDG